MLSGGSYLKRRPRLLSRGVAKAPEPYEPKFLLPTSSGVLPSVECRWCASSAVQGCPQRLAAFLNSTFLIPPARGPCQASGVVFFCVRRQRSDEQEIPAGNSFWLWAFDVSMLRGSAVARSVAEYPDDGPLAAGVRAAAVGD